MVLELIHDCPSMEFANNGLAIISFGILNVPLELSSDVELEFVMHVCTPLNIVWWKRNTPLILWCNTLSAYLDYAWCKFHSLISI